jgi:hypothetical protein
MPDGRVIKNVPKGVTKDQIISKLEKSGYDVSFYRSAQKPKSEPDAIPQRIEPPSLYEQARPYVAPLVEAGTSIAGGLIGSRAGPYGALGGAALGYGAGMEAMEAADVYLGGKPSRSAMQAVAEPVQNVGTGALMELGGPLVAKGAGLAMKGLTKAAGKVADLFNTSEQKAAKIARNALGDDLPAVMNALKKVPEGTSVAAGVADVNSPVFQSLIDRALRRDPRFLLALEKAEGDTSLNALSRLAGGATATEVRASQEAAKKAVNEKLIPQLNVEMEAANIAGRKLPELEAEAARFGQAASQKVEDVRRFTAAGERAIEKAKQKVPVPGMPRMPVKYTYEAELAKRAEDVASQAADASLAFGEARRFSQAAADSLAAHGLKPLKADSVIGRIEQISKDPKLAGNKEVERSLKQVSKDIQKWTNEGGVIDAWALDAIRKNSVNSVIRQMYPGATKSQQKELAQGVLSRIKPEIVRAVEDAGGTGYGEYLTNYAKEMRGIAEQKLTGKALEMFKAGKEGRDNFVRLVQGESPEQVEKILGPGSYDIAREVSENTMSVLRDEASKVLRSQSAKKQASEGQEALAELLSQNISSFRLPSYLNTIVTSTNAALDSLERKIGEKAMNRLTEAFKSAKSTEELLTLLPTAERAKVTEALAKPEAWLKATAEALPGKGAGVAAGVTMNQLAGEKSQSQNAMRAR